MKAGAPASFPGLDGIRLVAAWAVVYSHCYPIAAGPSATDPLYRLLGGTFSFGDVAVQVFFIMSGFLLSTSLDANPDPLRYLANRVFRIVPGFCFAIVVSGLFIAPFLSTLGVREALSSSTAWASMLWSITGLADQIDMSLAASRYPDMARFLNGALWSIPYEMICYLVLLLLYLVLRKDSRVGVAALLLLALTLGGAMLGLTTTNWSALGTAVVKLPFALSIRTLPYFCGGVLFQAIHKRWGAPTPLVLAALTVLVGVALLAGRELPMALAMATAGPVVVIWLGARGGVLQRLTERFGDVSYGVYLFGWPVSLLVTRWSGSTSPLWVFTLSAPLVFALAYAMHRLVEVPVATSIKPFLFRRLPRFSHTPGAPLSRRVAQAMAYLACLATVASFVVYPYPPGANWFGSLWLQLVGLCLVMALILRFGESRHPLQSA